jgi:hypothetical protein
MLAAASSFALTCSAAAVESYAPAPLPVASEPAPRLHVDEPLPEALARGLVVIRYRTDNVRILPVFGPAALDVTPRVGHLHVTVDEAPWHWADASGVPLIIQGAARRAAQGPGPACRPDPQGDREQDIRVRHSAAEHGP